MELDNLKIILQDTIKTKIIIIKLTLKCPKLHLLQFILKDATVKLTLGVV